ncbi:MAG: hypothetical protein ACOCRX_06820 [Candidatus Woesearchaeota archaeon]
MAQNMLKTILKEKDPIKAVASTMDFVELKENSRKYKGFIADRPGFSLPYEREKALIFSGWQEKVEWADRQYRRVFVHYEANAIFTYCEGDIYLRSFDNEKDFEKELESIEKYYKKIS